MSEQNIHILTQKILDEFTRLIPGCEPELICGKCIPPTLRGFINSLRVCHEDFKDTYPICLFEVDNTRSYTSTLISSNLELLKVSKCEFLINSNPPHMIREKNKCGFREVTKNHTCFIVDNDPLIYIILPDTLIESFLPSIRLISSISLAFSKVFKEFEEIKNTLARKEREYRDFIHYISHGLKSPLTSILGFSNLLADNYNLLSTEEMYFYGEKIFNNSRLLNTMLEELVSLERIKIEMEESDTGGVLNLVLKRFSKNIHEKKIKINVSKALPRVLMSSAHLSRIFESIIRNCIEFCAQGTEVTVEFENGEIIIGDNGPGIPETLIGKIGQPFISTKPKLNYSPGMGLFRVRKIVEAYGGSMRIESQRGFGTKIYLRLPYSEKQKS